MMLSRPIRNLNSHNSIPKRVFDVEVSDDHVDLIIKMPTGLERISWSSVSFQVNQAIEDERQQRLIS